MPVPQHMSNKVHSFQSFNLYSANIVRRLPSSSVSLQSRTEHGMSVCSVGTLKLTRPQKGRSSWLPSALEASSVITIYGALWGTVFTMWGPRGLLRRSRQQARPAARRAAVMLLRDGCQRIHERRAGL